MTETMAIKIRKSAILHPYSVGSILESEGKSFVVKPIGKWNQGNMENIMIPSFKNRIAGIKEILTPKVDTSGESKFELPVRRFPQWHFCSNESCRKMYYLQSAQDKAQCTSSRCENKELTPMRWVQVCENGHMSDIRWEYWCHRFSDSNQRCSSFNSKTLKFVTKPGGDFEDMEIQCTECNAKTNLNFIRSEKPLCNGRHAFHPSQQEDCLTSENKKITAKFEPRGSAALHYPKFISGLDLSVNEVEMSIRDLDQYKWSLDAFRLNSSDLEQDEGAKRMIQQIANAHGLDIDASWEIFLEDIRSNEDDDENYVTDYNIESLQKELLYQEFDLLSKSSDVKQKDLFLTLEKIPPNSPIKKYVDRVLRVQRVGEVRAVLGFTRVRPEGKQIDVDIHDKRDWIPGIKVFGEGIFVQLNGSEVRAWLEREATSLKQRINSIKLIYQDYPVGQTMNSSPDPAFILLHTFSHQLISEMAFYSGYSANSMKERIYSYPEADHYGVLIYTADSDSEGSLGGLQELGKINNFEKVFYRSIEKSRWCSNDPVCRESNGLGVQALNRAACHACSLIPETSCVYNNTLLDRVLMSGDADNHAGELKGFFSEIGIINGNL